MAANSSRSLKFLVVNGGAALLFPNLHVVARSTRGTIKGRVSLRGKGPLGVGGGGGGV